MNKATITLFALSLAGVLVISEGHSQNVDNVETFMRAKLTHSQRVLEGLATQDFAIIAKHAQEMSLLSQATAWQVLQTPEYSRRSADFRRSTERLTEAAKEKNLDGATLAFVDVTMKCVECHKYVRRVQNARIDDINLPGLDTHQVRIGPTRTLFSNERK